MRMSDPRRPPIPGAQATAIRLADFRSAPMRAFHMSWLSFFTAFVAWFAAAPLMPLIREDLGLSPAQIGNSVIASVAITFFARLAVGRLLDHYGPRRVYAWLLLLGALPVMGLGLARDYASFLALRMAIGAIGASFVITQFHTAQMFAPNVVGTANAAAAGWGNLGGGATQLLMPLLVSALASLGVEAWLGWRVAMIVPGAAMLLLGALYPRLTQDTPEGNFADRPRRAAGAAPSGFAVAARDPRVWGLFVAYGACFGIEITLDNVAALYFFDRFGLSLGAAGAVAAGFGGMNLFARALGGWLSDRVGARRGVAGRATLLGLLLLCEGFALVAFSRAGALALSIAALITVGLFVKMANGATYGVVPFVSRRALGSVTGIVGAGGNAGAVAAGFLFRLEGVAPQQAFLWLGAVVTFVSGFAFVVSLLADDQERAAVRADDAELAA
jgi:NNP family nitrate/nitrite transporter-like MFS transporter